MARPGRFLLPGILFAVGLLLLIGGLAYGPGGGGEVDRIGSLALGLAIILTVAKLGGDLMQRLGQPAVLGEVLGGMALGNLPGVELFHALGTDPHLDIVGQLGMLLLLFEAGLESTVQEFLSVGVSSLLVALAGSVASFLLGYGVAGVFLPDAPGIVRVFVGAAIMATSIGISARVLQDLGAGRSREARIVLGAAVADDILALAALALITAWSTAPLGAASVRWISVAALIAKVLGFLVLAIVIGVKLTPLWFRHAGNLRSRGTLLAVSLSFCFLLAWAASAVGLAPLVGAFAAGLVLEESHSAPFVQRGERSLPELMQSLSSIFVPVFFVLIGIRTNLGVLLQPGALAMSLALTVAAVVGKLACGAGALGPGLRKLTVALAMVPRGEVSLIFASIGVSLHAGGRSILDARAYSAVVAVVMLTTLFTPMALRWALRRPERTVRDTAGKA
jgi:Na+:H+ antiporter